MWEVKSGKNTCYLLGSIHIGDSTLYPLPKPITDAFDQSDVLVLEIDISNVDPSDVLKYTFLPDTLTLAGAVDQNVYDKFTQLFKKHNVPQLAYDKMKPWFAVLTLQSLELMSNDYSPQFGIDMYFLDKANEKELKIKELENLEFQMKVLDTLNQYTGQFLDYTLDELNESANQIDSIMQAWKTGDTKMMNNLINEGSDIKDFDQIMQHINYSRNYNMVNKIEEYLKDKKTHFVVVGAAHLLGEEGIINLLNKKKKYKISQK